MAENMVRSRTVKPRCLRVEGLERRDLLAVALVPGTETFKSFEFTAAGSLDVQGTWRVYEPRVYDIRFSGKTTVFHGTANYTSRNQASVEVDAVAARGDYFLPPPYKNGRFSFTDGTITDGTVGPVPGNANYFIGQLDGNVQMTGQVNGQVVLDGPITGTFDGAKRSLNLRYSEGDVKLRVWGAIRPVSGEPFRVEVQNAAWTAQGMEVDVVAPGGVAKVGSDKTLNHNSPVALVRIYWAAGPDFGQRLKTLGDRLPVYWNQASGKYEVTGLAMPPRGATHLLLVPEYKDVRGNTVRGNVFALALPERPVLSIDDVAIAEGNSGTTPLDFHVTLSSPLPFAILVSFATKDQTAKSADRDYVPRSGMLRFAPGETAKTLSVSIRGDGKPERNETFGVKLSGPTWATIPKSVGIGTIIDDDTPPAAFDAALQGLSRPDPAAELASIFVAERRKTSKNSLIFAEDAAFV